jgi:hypothetical protein
VYRSRRSANSTTEVLNIGGSAFHKVALHEENASENIG